jgi:hypothetical protein
MMMSRLKVLVLMSITFLIVLVIGFLGIQGWPVEAAHLTLKIDHVEATIPPSSTPLSMTDGNPSSNPTPTPVTGIDPPEFPVCPAGFELFGTYDDYIRRDIEPGSHSYPFALPDEGIVRLEGWVMEGHPDLGCPGHPDCDEIQDHEDIIFEIDGDVLGIYEDSEHGPYENAWYFFGPMSTDLAGGSHTLTFRHTLLGDDAQSVGYRYSFCGQVERSPTPTSTPELTSTFTSTPTLSPTDPTVQPSLTPTPPFAPTPTNTPPPPSGLIIFGNVEAADLGPDISERGLAGVQIYLAFASYPGKVVAVTEQDGSYRSDFIHIPVDETIRVWAQKAGYRFEPLEDVWRFYADYVQEREIDFIAYPDAVTVTPITPTSTTTATPTPEPIEPSCQLLAKPRLPSGYFLFEEVGKIYRTDGIFDVQAGTVSTWVCLEPNHDRRDHSIFHTSDSRFVLYFDTYFSSSWQVEISRFVARGGGTHRAVDSGYANGNFPEASIIVDNDGSLREYGANTDWYDPAPFPEGEWHLVTMTWEGYPQGVVKIFLDGNLIGQKPYDERYNDQRPLADTIAIGFRPAEWLGEVYVSGDQVEYEYVPNTPMALWDGGIHVFDVRLYQRSLNRDEIQAIFLEVRPYP